MPNHYKRAEQKAERNYVQAFAILLARIVDQYPGLVFDDAIMHAIGILESHNKIVIDLTDDMKNKIREKFIKIKKTKEYLQHMTEEKNCKLPY